MAFGLIPLTRKGVSGLSDFEQQFQKMSRQVQEQLASFEERRTAIADAVGTGDSKDGLVTATVTAGGVLQDLIINPRAMRLPSEALSESVKDAVRAANEHLAALLREISSATVDVNALMQQVQLPPELRRVMEQFDSRVSDIGFNLDKLRRDLERDRP